MIDSFKEYLTNWGNIYDTMLSEKKKQKLIFLRVYIDAFFNKKIKAGKNNHQNVKSTYL